MEESSSGGQSGLEIVMVNTVVEGWAGAGPWDISNSGFELLNHVI